MTNSRAKQRPRRVLLDPHQARLALIGDIVADAVLIVKGKKRANKTERMECRKFLQSERCQLWVDYLGVDYECLTDIL